MRLDQRRWRWYRILLAVEELARHGSEALRSRAQEALAVVGQVEHRAVRQRRATRGPCSQNSSFKRSTSVDCFTSGRRSTRVVDVAANALRAGGAGAQAIAEIVGQSGDRRARPAALEHAAPFFRHIAPSSRVPGDGTFCTARRDPGPSTTARPTSSRDESAADGRWRARPRSVRRADSRQVDIAQAQAVDEIADGAGEVGDGGLLLAPSDEP